MRPPCEIVIGQLLPALRALISHHLIQDYGFTQSQVANQLGITQASVSRNLNFLKRFEQYYTPTVRQFARSFAQQLAEHNLPMESCIASLCSFCQNQKIGGIVCRIHRQETTELASCDVCSEGVSQTSRANVLKSLERGMKLLEATEEFTPLIPQVQSQVVMSIPGAANTDDVAGFPSRIGSLHKRAHSFKRPEFGGSEHLSGVLLFVQRYIPNHRAALVFKYTQNLENALRKEGLAYRKISRKTVQNRRDTDEALIVAMKEVLEQDSSIDVFIDEGIIGIEPVAYLFSIDAETVVKKTIGLAKLLFPKSKA